MPLPQNQGFRMVSSYLINLENLCYLQCLQYFVVNYAVGGSVSSSRQRTMGPLF